MTSDEVAVIATASSDVRDLPAVVETLSTAFDEVPIFRWFFPDDERRAAILPAFFAAVCEAHLSWGEIHRSADGLAAAVWVPPGAEMPAEVSATLGDRLGGILGEEAATKMADLRPLIRAHHPDGPHWFLNFLAVRPEAQGRGYGTALLRPMLDRCDAEGVPAYLDATSEANKRLYERERFVVVQEVTLRDSPPLWCMVREAQ